MVGAPEQCRYLPRGSSREDQSRILYPAAVWECRERGMNDAPKLPIFLREYPKTMNKIRPTTMSDLPRKREQSNH
jgi:hypothetical protein